MRVMAMLGQKGHFGRGLALRCALVCLIGTALAGTAKAEEGSFLDNVMSVIGLKNSENTPSIDYRERSPLVIPPKRSLPAPERGAAETNPAWPVDPEIKQKKESDALNTNSSETFDIESRPLRPDQMTPGRKFAKPVRRQAEVPNASGDNNGRPLSPNELGYNGGLFGMFKPGKDEEVGKFVAEPPRASLTDPPLGYQTPSPGSPYGLTKDKTPPKAVDYKTQHGTDMN